MNQQEKFKKRMDTLPPRCLIKILVITDQDGNIQDWIFEDEIKTEGRPDYLSAPMEKPE